MKKITSIILCLLLVFSTVICLLLSPTSVAADNTTPSRFAWDFEDGATPKDGDLRSAASGSTTAISIKEKALSLSISNTSAMDGRYISYYIPVDGLKVDTEYQVSGRYKLVKGDLTHLRFGSFGGAKSGTNGAAFSNYYSAINNTSTTAMTDFTAFSGSFTSTSTTASSNATNSDPKYLIIGMYVTPSSSTTEVELLVDDLVFAKVDNDSDDDSDDDTTLPRFAWDFSTAPTETVEYKGRTAALTENVDGPHVANGVLTLGVTSESALDFYAFKIDVSGLKAGTTYNYSVDYSITAGTFEKFVFGAYDAWNSVTSLVNATGNLTFTPIIISSNIQTTGSVNQTFTTSESTAPTFVYIGFRASGKFSINFDNLVVSEVIDDNDNGDDTTPTLPPPLSYTASDKVGLAFAGTNDTVFSAENASTSLGDVVKTTAWRHPEATTEYAYAITPKNYANYAAIPLTFEKDTYYSISFYYWSEEVSTQRTFSNVRIMRDGGTLGNDVDNLGAATTTASTYANKQGAIINLSYKIEPAEACQWNKMTMAFYSGDNTSGWLALRHVVSGKDAYVDGLTIEKLSEPLPQSDAKPFAGWGEPQDESIINFDDFYVYFDQPDRFEVATAPLPRDGKTSKALHCVPGTFSANGLLNKNEFSVNNTKRDKVFTIPVKPNTKYTFGFWAYLPKDEIAVPYCPIFIDYKNTGTVSYKTVIYLQNLTTREEWTWFETDFITDADQTFITITANLGKVASGLWVDDFTLTASIPGVLADASNASYCEEFYNILAEQDSFKDMAAAKSGVYPIAVEELQYYTFGATISSNNANSTSRIFLSFDGVTPMAKSMAEAPDGIITAKTNERISYNIMNTTTDKIYLVIENDDNALSVEDMQLFKTTSNTVSLPMGYEENPNQSLEKATSLKEIKLIGEDNDDDQAENEDPDENEDVMESPATGSKSILPIVLIGLSVALLGAVLVFTKKGGAQYE